MADPVKLTSFMTIDDDPPATTHDGSIVLIPQPSSDPHDPLNWPLARKATNLAVLFLALFTGFAAPFCGQLNIQQQAALYHKTTVQITYFNSAASAGLATGGYLWWPLSHKYGRTAVIFWAAWGLLAAQVWAPLMTRPDDYLAYLLSRLAAGFFGIVVSILGPRYLVDMFFLHQRGRAFTLLHLALNFGASVGPTISGFAAATSDWPVEYWWSVALCATSIVCVGLFLEETTWDRTPGAVNRVKPASSSWWRHRFETLFGVGVVVGGSAVTWSEVARISLRPFKLMLAPVVLIIAGFDTIAFAFYVALNALTPVWLQTPLAAGGIYGFSVAQNAAFTLVHWAGVLLGLIYGQLVSDRLPLWLAAHCGTPRGVWKPEYRLHALWPTNFVMMPVGLGLVGAAMAYRLHWSVMAVAQLLVTIGSLISIPTTVNYICECFRTHTVEATLVLNSMRLFMGLSINFYIQPWIAAVGIGWVYGQQAFFSLFAFCFVVVLMVWGRQIRALSPFSTSKSEEGEHIVEQAM